MLILVNTFLYFHIHYLERCEIVVPLGMEDPINGIADSSITASSYYSKDYGPWNARLFQSRG